VNVLVDTSVWSLALRRKSSSERPEVAELRALVEDGRVAMVGAIRQELLSGVRATQQFKRLRDALRAFPDLPLDEEDYEEGAACFNRCRSRGLQGSNTDFLLCAVALRRKISIFTTDGDFAGFASILDFELHQPR
jgi:predicted nucleic acid-binding protein